MSPKLYMMAHSPPSRAVQMTAKAIGLELELKEIDLRESEHLTPEYLKLNPTHTLPTLVDSDGFVVWESHAIMPYLTEKYAKDKSLYPEDIKIRATINQRLHFESGVFYPRCLQIFYPVVRKGKTTIDKEDVDSIQETYGFLENFLEGNEWIAGDSLSIADFSLVASVTSIDIIIPVDPEKYPKISEWLKKVQDLPAYAANTKGHALFKEYIKSYLQ